jgi:hypothetical protein
MAELSMFLAEELRERRPQTEFPALPDRALTSRPTRRPMMIAPKSCPMTDSSLVTNREKARPGTMSPSKRLTQVLVSV